MSIITFSSSAAVNLPFSEGESIAAIDAVIDDIGWGSMAFSGGTNIIAGLNQALPDLLSLGDEYLNVAMLFTDGEQGAGYGGSSAAIATAARPDEVVGTTSQGGIRTRETEQNAGTVHQKGERESDEEERTNASGVVAGAPTRNPIARCSTTP